MQEEEKAQARVPEENPNPSSKPIIPIPLHNSPLNAEAVIDRSGDDLDLEENKAPSKQAKEQPPQKVSGLPPLPKEEGSSHHYNPHAPLEEEEEEYGDDGIAEAFLGMDLNNLTPPPPSSSNEEHTAPEEEEKDKIKSQYIKTGVKTSLDMATTYTPEILGYLSKLPTGEIRRYEMAFPELAQEGVSSRAEKQNQTDVENYRKIFKRGATLAEEPLKQMFKQSAKAPSPGWQLAGIACLTGYELGAAIMETRRENKLFMDDLRGRVHRAFEAEEKARAAEQALQKEREAFEKEREEMERLRAQVQAEAEAGEEKDKGKANG